jgi:hypothetical protein
MDESLELTVRANVNMAGGAFSTFVRFIVSCCEGTTDDESMPRSRNHKSKVPCGTQYIE